MLLNLTFIKLTIHIKFISSHSVVNTDTFAYGNWYILRGKELQHYTYAFKETHKYINTEEEEEVRKVSQDENVLKINTYIRKKREKEPDVNYYYFFPEMQRNSVLFFFSF